MIFKKNVTKNLVRIEKKYIFVICLINKSNDMKTTHTQNAKNQKYNKSLIMRRAWEFKHANKYETLSECLKASWSIAKNGTANLTFNKAYADNYNTILNFVNYKIRNFENAEEITNDIFLKVHEHFKNYDVKKAGFKTWLYTITNRKIIDYYRKNANVEQVTHIDNFVNEEGKETIQIESNINESGIEQTEITEAVKKAITNLNPKEQKITQLYFLEQKQYKEVSEILQIPVGSVKGTINRIRAKLQESLQNEYLTL